MSRRRRLLYLVIATALMLRTLWHIFVYGIRPIDIVTLLVDVLIFLFVGYEVLFGGGVFPRRKLRRRFRQAVTFIDKGQHLQRTAPSEPHDYDDESAHKARRREAKNWSDTVEEWVLETEGFLQNCPPAAWAKFDDDSGPERRLSYGNIDSQVWDYYDMLDRRLSNLQEIVQNADVYLI